MAAALFLLVLTFIIMAMRMHFITLPLDRDEGTYAYIAWRMDFGEMPYRDIIDHKPPIVYFLYNAAFKMFGANYTAVRGFSALYVILIMVSVFFTAKRIFGGRAAYFASALFSVFQGSVVFQAINANTELFLLLPLMLSLYFAAGERKTEYFFSGILFSAAVFTKPAVIYSALLWVVYWAVKKEKNGAIFFISGAVSFAAAVLVWAMSKAILPSFVEYVIKFNVLYARMKAGFRVKALTDFILENGVLLSSYFYSAIVIFKKEGTRGETLLFIMTTGLAAGIISLGGTYEHYYLVLYAPLCVSTGSMFSRLSRIQNRMKRNAAAGAFLLFFAVTFPVCNFELYRAPFIQVTGRQYGYTVFYETPIIAQKINEIKGPDTTLFVWPSEPEIYFYTGVRSMFRQISVLPAYSAYYGAQVSGLLADAEKEKPGLIVVTTKYGAPFDWIIKNYDLVMMTRNNALFALKNPGINK
jgi:4-amino-4-deoxy-L-arabinose transferase-like glycosyltransferase